MANWFVLTLIAAFFLGLYDIAKKHSVADNAVPAVLLLNVSTAASIWAVPIIYELGAGQSFVASIEVCNIGFSEHLLLFGKSVLVSVSWMFAFFGIKHLPISIAAPIRSTSPFWTIILAVVFMGERPLTIQWLGIGLIVIAFYSFSMVGLKEGIQFSRDRYVWLMVLATLVGATSGLYDKYLLQVVKIEPAQVQAWFSIYLVPALTPMFIYWFWFERTVNRFEFRWSIPLIAVFLLLADYFYFVAVADPDALISIISPLRRSSILIAFSYGIWILGEKNWRSKLWCLGILMAGIYTVSLSQR